MLHRVQKDLKYLIILFCITKSYTFVQKIMQYDKTPIYLKQQLDGERQIFKVNFLMVPYKKKDTTALKLRNF